MVRKRSIAMIAGLLLLGAFGKAVAQQAAQPPKIHRPSARTFLNGGLIGNHDSLSVAQFDSLLSLRLTAKDSVGRTFPVHSFSFIYVNRGVYSDSTGHPVVLSDYLYSTSKDGLLPEYWRKGLIPQVKAGDTAIFTDIRYYADTAEKAPLLYGQTMRITLIP